MTDIDIDIDLVPDPDQDAEARRAALALVAAGLEDDELAEQEQAGTALQDLLAIVVGPVEVRPESAAALSAMPSTVGRQFNAFASLAWIVADEAFAAGQAAPPGTRPDHEQVLAAVADVVEQLAAEQR